MATNNTRQISKLQVEKARLLARIEQIDALIEELSQVDELADAVQEVLDTTPGPRGQRSSKGQHCETGHWYEDRTINGCGPYRYEYWRTADGRKHQKYHGKAPKTA